MPTGTSADPADLVAKIGRHWGWVLAFGIITVALGIAALAWPGRTIVVVAVLFGIQLIVLGIFRFVNAIAADDLTAGNRVLLALLGVLSLIIGLYALRHVLVTLVALAVLLGIFWIVSGTVELFMVLSHREMNNRGWNAITAGLSVIAGIIVLAYPGISLLVLAVVLSIWLVVFGVMQISTAVRIRSLGASA
ncbi:MAG: HdeD family acid-resistance protein [Streptosporangiaceae bacterium]